MSNNYFTIQENYRERFYQLPKVFFTNPTYMKLKNDSKIAYAILQDRLQLSIKNEWIDEDGRIYFVYTDKKLMEILNVSKNHVTTIKKELKEANLLIQKRQGLNKPNISYLLKPQITKEDICKIEVRDKDYEVNSIKDSQNMGIQNPKIWESRIPKYGSLNSHEMGTNDTDFNDTDFNDTDFNDTTTTKTETNSSGGSREKYLIKLLKEEMSVRPTKAFIEKIADLTKDMNPDLLEYAIKYASENGNNPKQYLAKILQVWSNNHIYNLEQAQNFSVKSNIHSLKSKEKTPRWITHPEEFKLKEENDQELAAEAQAFKEHLTKKEEIINK
ncbi:TPA: replication initiator protein A [Staphylococcus aureus]|nr:replication initiator protein A [Staphylococcus aureus]